MTHQLEIERKFLVHQEALPELKGGILIHQGYIAVDPMREVRIRMTEEQAFLGIKIWCGEKMRHEYTYPIPIKEAEHILSSCLGSLSKMRYTLNMMGVIWYVDCFQGPRKGLVLAEVELDSNDTTLIFPAWVGKEVTHQKKYYNCFLACEQDIGSYID